MGARGSGLGTVEGIGIDGCCIAAAAAGDGAVDAGANEGDWAVCSGGAELWASGGMELKDDTWLRGGGRTLFTETSCADSTS
jgi:hypothetical protein